MCGIAGIVDYDSRCELATVQRMIGVQHHRGPDGDGVAVFDHCALGHARLAIIDLSDRGRQPMTDASGRYTLVFNGEIYNYVELREELRLTYAFESDCDAEVLLAAYVTWGEACLPKLRGMFAFAVWDEREQTLFAARDRFGIKPFHYWADGRRFAFASELKALVDFLPQRRADPRLAAQFIAWNLLDHEPEQTMIEGIRRLPAAHSLRLSRGGMTVQRYWDVEFSDALTADAAAERRYAREFAERFRESVRLHLRADVPVGTCLSGGLDSSALAGFINEELRAVNASANQHTFSACFEDPAIDERRYMDAVNEKLGCSAHAVFPDGEQLAADMDRWLWHQEEPIGGTGGYAQYRVARLAAENGVKVLLDGQGSDEIFAGYRKFVLVYLRQLVARKRFVRAAREAAAFGLSWELLRTSRFTHGRRYFLRSVGEVDRLFAGRTTPPRPAGLGLRSTLGQRLADDVRFFSLPVLLRLEDRNMAAFGLEGRVPFLDHVFVEWAATLPASMRLSNGWTKHVLREGSASVLPDLVRRRKSKLGFSTPEARWLAGPLSGWVESKLSDPQHLAEHVDVNAVRTMLEAHRAGKASAGEQTVLFRLAAYETWARLFLS